MLESLTALPGLLAALVEAVGRLEPRQEADAQLQGRIRQLELSQEKWEARMEGEFMRAEAQYKASRSAEERAKTREKNAERIAASLEAGEDELEGVDPDALREWQAQFPGGYAGGGEAEGVQPVRSRVEDRRETRARLRASKFTGR